MGIYLNPNNVLFTNNLNSPIYVDKSMLIEKLNNLMDKSASKYICVTRPRRFGKTMATNLISAFYSKGCDSRSLFSNLKIAQTPDWDQNLNKFNLIKIDVQAIFSTLDDPEYLVSKINTKVNKELIEAFPNSKIKKNDNLGISLLKVYSTTGEQFIIIMDEFDVLVREQVPEKALLKYIKFLTSLFKYSTLSPAIHLAYLTGILPIIKGRFEETLCDINEDSMTCGRYLSDLIGFTEEEVQKLCEKHDMDFAECKKWYDGYKIGNSVSIFNPQTIVCAITNHHFGYYWNETGSPRNIHDYITLNFKGLKDDVITMLNKDHVPINTLSFSNTLTEFTSKDAVFTFLIHLGYLAYESYKEPHLLLTGTCWIPNNEIRDEWINVIEDIPNYS